MGIIKTFNAWVFFIVSADRNDWKRKINVKSEKSGYSESAKFWLEPIVSLASKNQTPLKGGFSDKEIRKIQKYIEKNKDSFIKAYDEFFKKRESQNN